MTNHIEAAGRSGEPQIVLRTPAELADALPYLLGFTPENSIVLMAQHGPRGRFGGRVRLGVPDSEEDWPAAAEQVAQCLVHGSEKRRGRPDGIVVFLCREPGAEESGQQIMESLRPLAQALRLACGSLDVPVLEALCISEGQFWSYVCPDPRCCAPDGTPVAPPGTSVMAATATYAGLRVRGTLSDMEGRLAPWQGASSRDQQRALDAAGPELMPRMLDEEAQQGVAEDTLDLAELLMRRFREAPHVTGTLDADTRDDELVAHDEAAALVLGLQDRTTRDRAAEWMEGDIAGPAMRLWRALARRCVGEYGEHAAAPLSLAGWVAWSMGDEAEARVALDMALRADPRYTFALLLHQACNEGLDPEPVRRCLRQERAERSEQAVSGERDDADRSTRADSSDADLKAARGTGPERQPASVRGRRSRRAPFGRSGRSSGARKGPWAPGRTGPVGATGPRTPHRPGDSADRSARRAPEAPQRGRRRGSGRGSGRGL